MRKGIIILLIIAAALTLLGGAIFTVGIIAMGDGGFSVLNNEYQTKTYEASDKIDAIIIKTDTSDVEILPYDNEGYKVECIEEKNLSHAVSVNNGSLCIEIVDTRAWYDYIRLFSKPTKITVYIPACEYSSLSLSASTGDCSISSDLIFDQANIACSTGDVTFLAETKDTLNIAVSTGQIKVEASTHGDVSLSTSTGDITLNKLTCKNVKTAVSTGKITITELSCDDFISTGSTGDLLLTALAARGTVSVDRSTGDVKLDKCDAAELRITTDTGDVTGTLLTSKVFIYDTDTGNVSLPETTTGGICKITTDTGDIKISIAK